MTRQEITNLDTLIGYVVLGGSQECFPTRMVADLAAANRLTRGWDRQIRRYYGGGFDTSIAAVRRSPDGTVYVAAGGGSTGEIGTGYAGLGLNGSNAVDKTIAWLRNRPARWLRKYGITLEAVAP